MVENRLLVATLPMVLLALAACASTPPAPLPAPGAAQSAVAQKAPVCPEGSADCDGTTSNGCETEVDFSAQHCGRCGEVCDGDARCVFGICRRTGIMASGWEHHCWLTGTGGVHCRGDNFGGELGDGTSISNGSGELPATLPPAYVTPVASITDALETTAGGDLLYGRTSCSLSRSKKVSCWGRHSGTLPVHLPAFNGAIDIQVGSARLCVVRKPGIVSCGDIAERGDFRLSKLDAIGGISDAVQIVIGVDAGTSDSACALRRSGGVFCWGDRKFPPIGRIGAVLDETTVLTHVDEIKDAVHLAGSFSHYCVARRDGGVVCWGSNEHGQLGRGYVDSRLSPAEVAGIHDVVEVAVGASHTCALRRDGTVACWGERLGFKPKPIEGVLGATHITAGNGSACALLRSGKVVCWESDDHGWSPPKVVDTLVR